MDLADLVEQIRGIHDRLALHAIRAVNVALTARNWLIGGHIHEYELTGQDRSRYGERVLDILAERLTDHGLANCNRRQLYRYRDFYRRYPQIAGTLSPQLRGMLPAPIGSENVGTPSPQFAEPAVPPQKLVETLLFVSKYRLALPDEAEMRKFIEARLKDGTGDRVSMSERTSSGRKQRPADAKSRAEHRKPRAPKRGAARPRRKKR